MMMKKIRVLTDLLDHLQQDRLDMMRQVEEWDEQATVVAELLRAAVAVHEAEADKDDDEGKGEGESDEPLNGLFPTMEQEFLDFLAKVHTTSKEDDDHDED